MKISSRLTILTAAVALTATPALASLPSQAPSNSGTNTASGAPYSGSNNPSGTTGATGATGPYNGSNNPGSTHKPSTPGPNASLPAKAKAYGKYCPVSKKHVAGVKGTPFSACVTAMAKAAHNSTLSPQKACANLSKKRLAGAKGTPFSICVRGAAKLQLADQKS